MPNLLALRKRQFKVLYRVFLLRVVDLELLSASGDPTKLMGQFASVFVTFSFFFSVPLIFMGGGTLEQSQAWMFEHFFLETSMTVAGLIAVLNWDAAFPDRRDALILAPLPVSSGTLLLAKIAALLAAPALAIAALNMFVGLLWPVMFRSPAAGFLGLLRSWPAYWITIAAGGAFFVFTVLTLQGLGANLLPRQTFLRLSAVLQSGCLCLLLSIYFLEPSLETPAALAAPENQPLLHWLPSYWFFALFNQLNGSTHPLLIPLARRAWIALGISALGAFAALLTCYLRLMKQLVEQPEILPASRSFVWPSGLGSSLTGAITFFTFRTIVRSRQHRTVLSFYLGIGIAIVAAYVKSTQAGLRSSATTIGSPFLLTSILLMILAVLALRIVASIPTSLPANWIIRITQIRPAADYVKGVRFAWLALGVSPALLLIAIFLLDTQPLSPSLGHFGLMIAFGLLLVELSLYRFVKFPFTCSYLPGKAQGHFVFWAGLMFFLHLLNDAAIFESRMLTHALGSILMMVALVSIAAAVRWVNESGAAPAQELLFEEEDPPVITALKLS
jgi:hypothetical protein